MTTISDRFKELPPSPTIEAMDEALSELWFRLELAGGQPGIQDRLLDVAELAYVAQGDGRQRGCEPCRGVHPSEGTASSWRHGNRRRPRRETACGALIAEESTPTWTSTVGEAVSSRLVRVRLNVNK